LQDSSGAVDDFEKRYVRPREGRTLIVGSRLYSGKEDRRQRFARAVGVDMQAGDGVDRVVNLEDDLPDDIGKFAHIECMSVLEHSRRPWLLAANLQRLLKRRGSIFLTVPFVWRFHAYDSDYYRFTAEGVRVLFPDVEWHALMYASNRLRPDEYLKAEEIGPEGHPFLPRCEVAGFGVKV
jgi:hypothetical protein